MNRSLCCSLLLIVTATVFTARNAHAGQFLEAKSYPGGAGTLAMATGDLNGDGKVDAVLANSTDHTVGVILGNGDGSFQAPMNFAAGTAVDYVAVGDFNKDGHLDAVAVNHLTSQVNVLLGNGDGTLQAAVPYSTGNSPRSVTVADVNNDGNVDLIAASGISNGSISVLLGNGDGTFRPHVESTIGGQPYRIAVADFNKDGKPDALSASTHSLKLQLSLGNGDGTFQAPQFVASFDGTDGVVVADFNQDGNLDFAASGLASVAVFLGNGSGLFPTENDLFLSFSSMLTAGDVNGDGKVDLVGGGLGASVLIGNGDGTFQTAAYYGSLNGDSSVALADVNGDGKVDFIGTQNFLTLGQLDVLLGIGGGHFLARRDFYPGGPGNYSVSGDFNGDGKLDVAVVNKCTSCINSSIGVLLGNGDGTFTTNPQQFTTGPKPASGIATGDLNGDGKLDLVVSLNDSVAVLLGNGDGTFQSHADFGHGVTALDLVLGDFNKDGHLDVAVADYGTSTINVYLGNGDGTLQAQTDYPVGKFSEHLATGDFNGDGKLDLVAANSGSNTLSLLFGVGDGTFQSQVQIPTAVAPDVIAVSDLNHDGKLDLAFSTNCPDFSKCFFQATVMLGNGDGTFGVPAYYPLPFGFAPEAIASGDINSDGVPDLVTAVQNTGQQISVLLGNGDGTFQARSDYAGGGFALILADFNRDNALDVVSSESMITVLLNTSGTVLKRGSSPNPSKQGQPVTLSVTVTASLPGQPMPTGKVTWKDGSTTLGTVTLQQGKAQLKTSSLSVGQHTITASYSGDAHFQANTASPLIQVVNP